MVRKTLQWIATILLLAGLGGSGYAYWLFTRSDEWLRAQVQEGLSARFPHAVFTIGSARFDWGRKVHAYDIRILSKGDREPIARFAEAVFAVDIDELTNNRTIEVRTIRIRQPDVRLTRDDKGNWNWKKLLPPAPSKDPLPEITFEDLQINATVARPAGGTTSLQLRQGAVKLVPSARRVFSIEATAAVPGLEDVHLEGTVDIEKKNWTLDGRIGAADLGELFETFRQTFPDTARRLAEFRPPAADSHANQPDFALRGAAGIDFRLASAEGGATPTYKVRVSLAQAEIEQAALPFPLQNVSGKVYVDNKRLELRNVEAWNGPTRVSLDGQIDLPTPLKANRVKIGVHDFLLDQRLRGQLSPALQRHWDTIHPKGKFDATGSIVRSEEGSWEPKDWVVTPKQCTAVHKDFPYPITEITGTIKQKGEPFAVDLRGRAGDRPARLTGTVAKLAPDSEAVYNIEAAKVPIDDAVYKAAEPHPEFRKTLAALKLRGLVDVHGRFHRPPGPNRKIEWRCRARVTDGSLEFEHFPYRIDDLQGLIAFDSRRGEWLFTDLKGSHGRAQLIGAASFVKVSPADRGEMTLEVQADNAPLSNDLQMALPPANRKLWDLIRPSGTLRSHIVVNWRPGAKPTVSIPEASVTDGALEIRAFPIPLEGVTTRFAYGPDPSTQHDKISILFFKGHHDSTMVLTPTFRTADESTTFILCPASDDPTNEWRVHIEGLQVDDLIPDSTFRRALPIGLRKTVQALNPQGKVQLFGMIELRGTQQPEDPVTAAWNIRSTVGGASIVTGIELKNVHGRVNCSGNWDGAAVRMLGAVDLDWVSAWKHDFQRVQGPFKLVDQELTVGSEKAFEVLAAGAQPTPMSYQERLTAHAVGGTFVLDAKAKLNAERTSYRVRAEMQSASLDRYANEYRLQGARSLHGVMNGWVELAGNSPDPNDVTGRGLLLIRPAALYELPVFVQVFKTLSLAQPDKTAFNDALASFSIGRRTVNFTGIDLNGDAISLRGRGAATFDGLLHLEFYSRPAQRWQFPVIGNLVDQVAKVAWAGVRVKGTVQNPIVNLVPNQEYDATVNAFLNAFNPQGAPLQLAPPPWMPAPPARAASANP